MSKFFSLGLIFGLMFLLTACSQMVYVPGEQMPPTDRDIAHVGPGSLKIDVANYQWSYINGNTHIRVTGNVINNTGQNVQSVTLSGILYDQDGTPIAYGTSYIYPTFMRPGGQGSFEFVGLTRRERGLKFTRLVTVCSAQVIR
jgi:hypothetical protein